MRRFSWVAIAGLLIAGLLIAGCGGGSSSSSTKSTATVPAITKAELVAKANAICTTGNGPLLAAAGRLALHPSPVEIATIVKTAYVPSIEAQIREIRALGVPAGEQAIVTRMLRLAEVDLKKLQSKPALINTDVFGGFARVAHAYGLTACAPTS